MHIILASTSAYRQALLDTLGIPFSRQDPGVVEVDVPGEAADVRAIRLAEAKAATVHHRAGSEDHLVIASDQVVRLGDQTLHKPGTFERAFAQLEACRGQWVTFTTAICLVGNRSPSRSSAEQFAVRFRKLTDEQIGSYLYRDRPWDCAGAIKAESLGVALIEDTRGRDVNTLYGLPLMLLVTMLQEAGTDVIMDFK